MKTCDVVQEKLVAGDRLTEEQQAHLEACPGCSDFQSAMALIVATADSVRVLAEPAGDEVSALQATLGRRTRPSRPAFRLAWAGAAMALGILLAIGILSSVFGPDPLDQSEDRLITLMDEVSQIADPDEEEAGVDASEVEGIYLAEVLLEDSNRVDTELQLPESYQLLEEALDNDWL